MAEELWQALGHNESLAYEPWPEFDPALAKEELIEVPVQINGKVRSKIKVAAEADEKAIESAAKAEPRIAELLAGKQIIKTIIVPGRLANFVIKS
jgi:leucyl-tRNA synthetase